MKTSHLKTIALGASLALANAATSYTFLRSDTIVMAVTTATPVPNEGETIIVETDYNAAEKEETIITTTYSDNRLEKITQFNEYNNDNTLNNTKYSNYT